MSAVLKDAAELASMRERDLAEVMAIESAVYSHPWSRGNFADSLRAGYECRTLRVGTELVGYFILMVAAGEAHLLNLSIAAAHQRSGRGSALLRDAASLARSLGARSLFLEVRPSNLGAQALYTRCGFRRSGVGRAGRLLDNMLAAIGLERGENVYIANVLKCRPPGNRNPQPEEVQKCAPHLARQIELIEPKLIVAMGRVAAQALLNSDASIASLRGRLHRYAGVPLIVTYHPAYLLRNLPDKAKAWADLVFARNTMAGL